MSAVRFPPGYRIEPLRRDHQRSAFRSGQAQVDDWLTTKALQNQEKHLSATKVLIDPIEAIAGFYTLSTAQVDFSDLPPDISLRLPPQPTGCYPGLARRSQCRSGSWTWAPPARPGAEG